MRTRLVITGHSRGLGAALAAEAQRRGLAVLGVSRGAGGLPTVDPDATLDWSAPALAQGAEVRLDLSDQSALQTWVQSGMMNAFFRGSEQALLINNAGLVSPIGPVGRLAVADIFNSVSLNVSAALALASAWVEQTQGVVTDRRLCMSPVAPRARLMPGGTCTAPPRRRWIITPGAFNWRQSKRKPYAACAYARWRLASSTPTCNRRYGKAMKQTFRCGKSLTS